MDFIEEHDELGKQMKRLQKQQDELLAACMALLMSADVAWEINNLGHDWPEACEQARAAIASVTADSEKEG